MLGEREVPVGKPWPEICHYPPPASARCLILQAALHFQPEGRVRGKAGNALGGPFPGFSVPPLYPQLHSHPEEPSPVCEGKGREGGRQGVRCDTLIGTPKNSVLREGEQV